MTSDVGRSDATDAKRGMTDYDGDRLIQLPAFTLDEIHRIFENTFSAPSRCDLMVRQRLQHIRDEFPPPPKPERTY